MTLISTRSSRIWADTSIRAASDLGPMSPNPTGESAVVVKYKLPARLRGSEK